ncbi:MAG: helix-turn-helix domain-containing protein [Isosphaeraceae bacterium]
MTELVRQGIRNAGPNSNDLKRQVVGPVERELIVQVLAACDRVQITAAARLGMNRNTLHKKLREYRIDGHGGQAGDGDGDGGEDPLGDGD